MPEDQSTLPSFADFGLAAPLLKAIDSIGYETPSPIQARAIPPLLAGRDVLGQAQTGTGKTAAFALPILSNIDLAQLSPQALVLVPTRELAIQVAEAFQHYAAHMKDLHVLPVYGGQDYGVQLRPLKRGVHIVVGTPGRVMDHMRRETLDLGGLRVLVLDEADEMLRMGFIDDVKWVLEQTPPERQIALFSATMPPQVRRIAQQHLRDPDEITIEVRTSTAETIHQRYWPVGHGHKLDALTRILEFEPFDGMLIFVKTKAATVELAERLNARGHACGALNGDIAQRMRERIVNQFKDGKIDILVATDVAARGLDVERISHVVNMDIPYDTESYVHRVGRTGRAGRKGEAILFVTPRERGMLAAIERATRQKIELLQMPTVEDVNDRRVTQFKQRITDMLALEDLGVFPEIITQYVQEHDCSPIDVAAALARRLQGDEPFLLPPPPRRPERPGYAERTGRAAAPSRDPRAPRDGAAPPRKEAAPRKDGPARAEIPPRKEAPARKDVEAEAKPKFAPLEFPEIVPDRGPRRDADVRMERFRLDVGASHGASARSIVGAIANEAGLEGEYIRALDIQDDCTFVDLPAMPPDIFNLLQNVRVAGRKLRIARADAPPPKGPKADRPAGPPRPKPKKRPGPKKGRKTT